MVLKFAITKLAARDIRAQAMEDRIVSIDRELMAPILASSGIAFPEEKRRAGLRDPTTTTILLLSSGSIAGYIEVCSDWSCREDIYLTSLQILPRYRRGAAFAILVGEAIAHLRPVAFQNIRFHVQAANTSVAGIARKFSFIPCSPASDGSVIFSAGRDALDTPIAVRLERRAMRRYTTGGGASDVAVFD